MHQQFDDNSCVEPSLAQQFNASAFDSLIGGGVVFDHVVQEYDFRFTAPDGVVSDYKWTLEPDSFASCPGAYYNVFVDGTSIWKTCYDGGVYQGHPPYRKAGNWKIELLEDGAVKWTAFASLKEGEIHKDSGDDQTGLISQPLQFPPVYSLRHYDGALVDAAQSSHGQPTNVSFTIAGPARAGGSAISPAYPDHGTSQQLNVTLGSKTGTYTVNATLTGAKLASPFTFNAATRLTPNDHGDNAEGNGNETCSSMVGDPIAVGIGNSFQQEADYVRTGLSPLEFVRSYNALGSRSTLMLNYWTTTFDRSVTPPAIAGAPVRIRRPDGRVIPYFLVNGGYVTRPYWHGVLRAVGSGWQYVDEDNVTENYDAQGHWTTISDADGRMLTATYTKGLLTKVAANTGEFLIFTYNTYNQLATATDQANRVWTYTYDGYSNLTQVRQPDGVYKTYHYESSASPFLITGESIGTTPTASQAQRYVTWEFDSAGRATVNYFGNVDNGTNQRRFDIAYNDADGTRLVTDGVGNQSLYKTQLINGRGFVDGVVGPGFSSCGVADSEVVRDDLMNVTSATAFGRVTQFGGYDAKGQYAVKIEAAGKPDARRTEYTYDARFIGKPTVITESSVAPGKVKATRLTYDAAGHLAATEVSGFQPDGTPVSRSVAVQYNGPYGQVSQIDGPRTDVADITYFDYDSTTKRLLRVTAANGVVERSNITYTPTGNVASEDRPNGVHVAYSYYAGNDLLKSVTETATGMVRSATWTYTDRRFVQSITFSDGAHPDLATIFAYTAAGDLASVASPGVAQITYSYDHAGNRLRDSNTFIGGSEYRWVQRMFDEYGRVRQLINPDNTSFTYFHPEGTLTHAIDGRGKDTTYQYDDFKRLIQVVQPGQLPTQFGYDVQDRLTSVTDANQATTLQTYDDLGNRLGLSSPDTGIATFDYDAAGNPTRATDALSQTTTSTFDALNRVKTVDRAGTADDETYAYDSCANGAGKLCSVSNGIGDFVRYEYDPLGRITRQTTNAGTVSYQRDASGAVTDVTYPSLRVVHFLHDAAGQTTDVSVTDGANTYVLARHIQHLPFGPASGWSDGNGLTEVRQYDKQYRPLRFTISGATTIDYSRYDGNSNLLQRNVYGDAQSFTYDAMDRLAAASGAFGERSYGYDPAGNRTSLTADGQTTLSSYEPQSNRLLADGQWTYLRDANGNETERKAPDGHGWDLTSTANNRLLGITDLQNPAMVLGGYRYNALGQRTVKGTPYGDTRFIYGLSGELLAELTAEGSVTQEYVYLDGAPIALLGVPTATDAPFLADQIIDNPASDPNCASKKASLAVNGSYLQCAVGTHWYFLSWPWEPPVSGDYDVSVMAAWTSTQQCYTFSLDGRFCTTAGMPAGSWLSLGRHHIGAGLTEPGIESSLHTSAINMDAIRYVLVHRDLTDRDYKYVHTDALGTPLRVTDKTGTVVWEASYDPFGRATVDEDPDGNGVHQTLNLRFPGQYYDAESGLQYNYHRDYDPADGRYLESDPIGLAGGINSYSYVGGDPIGNVDPLGLEQGVAYTAIYAGDGGVPQQTYIPVNVQVGLGVTGTGIMSINGEFGVGIDTNGRACGYRKVCTSNIGDNIGAYAGGGVACSAGTGGLSRGLSRTTQYVLEGGEWITAGGGVEVDQGSGAVSIGRGLIGVGQGGFIGKSTCETRMVCW